MPGYAGGGGSGSGGSTPISCDFGGFVLPSSSSPFLYEHRYVPFFDVEVPIYVIGWAYDGECAKSLYVENIDEADRVFGGVQVHRQQVTAGQRSFQVRLPIASLGWSVSVVSGGYLLSRVVVSGKTVQFDPVPSSGLIEFVYRAAPSVLDDVAYLPALLRAVFLLGCRHVVGVRVPGGKSASGTWSGWTVRARSEGSLYHGTRVRVYEDRIEVSVPNRPLRSYARNSDMYETFRLVDEVQLVPPPNAVWPSGLDVVLSGGYTAKFTVASLLALGNLWSPEVPGVVLVPGMGVSDDCYDAAAAFGAAMESAHCAVVYSTSISNLSSVTG